jgi:hypothetical protein
MAWPRLIMLVVVDVLPVVFDEVAPVVDPEVVVPPDVVVDPGVVPVVVVPVGGTPVMAAFKSANGMLRF